MTIHVVHNRVKEEGDTYTSSEEAPLKRALMLLLECEIQWSARVMDVTCTKVHVQTEVMGCTDDTIFVGSEHDMQLLVKAAFIANHARALLYSEEHRAPLIERALKWTGGNPLLLSLGAPLIMGGGIIRPTVIGLLTDDIGVAKRLTEFQLDDLLAMLYLKVEEGLSTADVIELAA